MRHALMALWLAPLFPPASAPGGQVKLVVVTAVTADGRASDDWLTILRSRLPAARYDSVAPLRKPLSADETAWVSLIRSRAPDWEGMIDTLLGPYRPVAPPPRVRIVLGNRGGDDAFTADPQTIGFDVSMLQSLYGSARQPGNPGRIDRFFRHEFTHILQKAWLVDHPWPQATPLDRALFDIWTEGLGNYYSLSDEWVDRGGLTGRATRALTDLEPRFADRLRGLACVDSAGAPALLAGLSSGPFDRKWGALPAALWLADDSGPPDRALRRLVEAGPGGVWDLADRHLAAPLRAILREARAGQTSCASR